MQYTPDIESHSLSQIYINFNTRKKNGVDWVRFPLNEYISDLESHSLNQIYISFNKYKKPGLIWWDFL